MLNPGHIPLILSLIGVVLGITVSWALGAVVAGIGVAYGLYLASGRQRAGTARH